MGGEGNVFSPSLSRAPPIPWATSPAGKVNEANSAAMKIKEARGSDPFFRGGSMLQPLGALVRFAWMLGI